MITLDTIRKRIADNLQQTMNVPYSLDTAVSRAIQQVWQEAYDEGYSDAWKDARAEFAHKESHEK